MTPGQKMSGTISSAHWSLFRSICAQEYGIALDSRDARQPRPQQDMQDICMYVSKMFNGKTSVNVHKKQCDSSERCSERNLQAREVDRVANVAFERHRTVVRGGLSRDTGLAYAPEGDLHYPKATCYRRHSNDIEWTQRIRPEAEIFGRRCGYHHRRYGAIEEDQFPTYNVSSKRYCMGYITVVRTLEPKAGVLAHTRRLGLMVGARCCQAAC